GSEEKDLEGNEEVEEIARREGEGETGQEKEEQRKAERVLLIGWAFSETLGDDTQGEPCAQRKKEGGEFIADEDDPVGGHVSAEPEYERGVDEAVAKKEERRSEAGAEREGGKEAPRLWSTAPRKEDDGCRDREEDREG